MSCTNNSITFSGGRSPVTWHFQEFADKVPLTDMNMRSNTSRNFPGRTYRFYTGRSIYEFGHGLSYTTFSKFIQSAPSTILVHVNSSNNFISSSIPLSSHVTTAGRLINVSDAECGGLEFDVKVGVKNGGAQNGTHVVLLFWKPPNSREVYGLPKKQLIGFDRVQVNEGDVKNVSIKVNVCRDMSVVDEQGKRKLILGQHTLLLGSSTERQVRHRINLRVFEEENAISSM